MKMLIKMIKYQKIKVKNYEGKSFNELLEIGKKKKLRLSILFGQELRKSYLIYDENNVH